MFMQCGLKAGEQGKSVPNNDVSVIISKVESALGARESVIKELVAKK